MTLKITNLPISDYMTAYPIAVESNVSFKKVINFMVQRGFGSLVVSGEKIPIGILTERDILKAIIDNKDFEKLTVKSIGHQPFVSLSLGNTVLDAAHSIRKKSRLLVFEGDKLVGIVTVSDLLRAFRKTRSDSALDHVMSTRVEKCKYSNSIISVIKLLHDKRIGSIVIEDREGFGIFTERDLLMVLSNDNFDLNDQVGKYSSSPLIVANVDIKVHEAANIMAGNNIKRLGLIKDGLLVGMVSGRDLVQAYQDVYLASNPKPDEIDK